MIPKQPLRAVNETGDVTVDVNLLEVPDNAIDANGKITITAGTGDVVGPASATDNAAVRFNLTTGKLVQDSTVIIADTTGNISGTQKITFSGSTSGTAALQAAAVAGTTTATLPTTTNTLGYLEIPQNSQSAAYEFVLTDSGKQIYHPVGDNNARAFTIPANASVAFPVGTAITVVNMAATASTMVITTDTLNYVDTGAVTTITIPQYNMVTVVKITTTSWLASGTAGVTTA